MRARTDTLPAIGETRNLSSGGVLFFSDAQIEPGETIEYTIQLDGEPAGPSIHCLGKVTRSQCGDGAEPCEVAATLERYEFVRVR